MYMLRTLTGTPRDVRDPAIRKINFDDEAHIRTVATSRAGTAAIGVDNSSRSDSRVEDQADVGGDHRVTKMKWPTSILLMPVYLAPGVNVRVMIADRPKQDGAEDEGPAPEDEEVGIFDGTDAMVVWYVRAAVEVQLVVESKVGGKNYGENEMKGEIDDETAGEDKAKGENTGDSNDEGGDRVTRDGVAAVFVVGVLCTTQHSALTKA